MELTLFCDTYIIAEYIRLKRVLNNMPRYTVGTHGGTLVIREYSKSGKETIRKTANENGRGFAEMHQHLLKYNKYANQFKLFTEIIKIRHLTCPTDLKLIKDPSSYNGNCWNDFVPNSNPYDIKTEYYDDYGNKVRSRGEMLIGNALKDLGLEAKYEPCLTLNNGRSIHPDYSFPVPIIDRCFFIEFIGMTDDIDYMNRNYGKIDEYMRNGILPNRDLILICGTNKWLPSQESIKRIIASFINNAVENVYNRNS